MKSTSQVPSYLYFLAKRSVVEIGRRDPIYRVHRWWGRRLSSIYRFMIAHHIFDHDPVMVGKALDKPEMMIPYTYGKYFIDPFSGGGTGIIEAYRSGFNVIAMDINPVAVAIARSMIFLSNGIGSEYRYIAIEILDRALNDLKNYLMYRDRQIVYILYTRGKIPTWIASRRKRNPIKITICPSCGALKNVLDNIDIARCDLCGYEYRVSKKPIETPRFKLCNLTPDGWLKAYASRIGNDWIPLSIDHELCSIIQRSLIDLEARIRMRRKIIEEIKIGTSKEIRKLLKGLRSNLANIFTPRIYMILDRLIEYINSIDTRYSILLKTALSESSKVATVITMWDPSVSEPIPAVSNKTLWVPEHGVEYNIVAHIPGTLKSIGRRGLASAIRDQIESIGSMSTLESLYLKRDNSYTILQGSLTDYTIPYNIDLAILDPPYPGGVENYTDLSLVHYMIFALFEGNIANLEDIRSKDLSNLDLNNYFKIFEDVVSKITEKLSSNGSIYILFNSKNPAVWRKLLKSIESLCIHDTYYILGESPGKLARSGVRGLFIIHLKPCRSTIQNDVIIYNLLDLINRRFKIKLNMDLEYKCIESFIKAFRDKHKANIALLNY